MQDARRLILIVIPHSSAAAGTRHGQANHEEHDSHEMPRSSAAIGSFTAALRKKIKDESVRKE